MASLPESLFDKEKHVKYWQRCHSVLLPSQYTSSESTRLTWACFIVSALDLLSVPLKSEDRSAIRTWVLSLQHPDGGFCGSPTHKLPDHNATQSNANLAATFFALILLAAAADDETQAQTAYEGVQRRKLLLWLNSLQRDDGSFGQNLWNGEAVGGRDMRHNYLASGIRWMIRGTAEEDIEDVNVESMIAHIRNGQVYDGGVAEGPQHESHAGYTYCALAALALLDRPGPSTTHPTPQAVESGVPDRARLLNFLAGRQFEYLVEEEDDEDDNEDGASENYIQATLGHLPAEDESHHTGLNGRWNKKADTCYYWWVAGALALLENPSVIDHPGSRRYILNVTQHRIGGFGKSVGGPPDMFHSYLGLAVLAITGEAGLKDLDVALCCTQDTVGKIRSARDGPTSQPSNQLDDGWRQDGFWNAMAK